MLHSRKFVLTLVAVVMVMAIAIGSALLKKYLAVDVGEVARWAMITIVSVTGLGSATIAYEDARKQPADQAK